MVIIQKIVFVHWVNFILPVPRGFGHFHGVEQDWEGVLWDRAAGKAGRGGLFFSQGGSQRGGASNRSSLICSLLPKTSILLDHPWLTGLSSEHRHQSLSQFPPVGVLTFACICSFLSLDLRGFCRIPSICRKGAKRAHGQGDETD